MSTIETQFWIGVALGAGFTLVAVAIVYVGAAWQDRDRAYDNDVGAHNEEDRF